MFLALRVDKFFILLWLYERSAREVWLGIFDGLPGLEEAIKTIYLKSDVQCFVLHKVRGTLHAVKK